MTSAPRSFVLDKFGVSVPGRPTSVVPDRAAAFSAAIADGIPDHVGGRAVTPMFNVVPIYSCLFSAVDLVTPEDLRTVIVHGAHDIRFGSPIRLGSTLSAVARVTGLQSVGAGTAVTVQITVSDDDGRVTSEQWATAIVRGEETTENVGGAAPHVDLSHGDSARAGLSICTPLDTDLPRRFAEASGDRNAIHLDDRAARQAGFDGVIMHGLCTMGIVSSAVITTVCEGEPSRLLRLAGRFAAPAYPDGNLTTTVQPLGDDRHAVEAAVGGTTVIKRALAEVTEQAYASLERWDGCPT